MSVAPVKLQLSIVILHPTFFPTWDAKYEKLVQDICVNPKKYIDASGGDNGQKKELLEMLCRDYICKDKDTGWLDPKVDSSTRNKMKCEVPSGIGMIAKIKYMDVLQFLLEWL